ncbi:MAG TPA: M50 family metallopeptidase [Ktedonobacterales bacterium]|nr:M50 family metallopeptidase [Ktedonobacterales bacterium]
MNPLFLLAAVPVFGLMVIVHEFGHFITAKRAGIRVEEFAIGFPPRLFSFRRGETLYSINLLPIGGYVRMPGENGETTDESGAYDPRSFAAKPARVRAMVLLAGVTMNLVLAIVLFSASEALGQVYFPAVIQNVQASSPAAAAGIQPGDRITTVNGQSVKYFSDMTRDVQAAVDAQLAQDPQATTVPIQLTVQRAGASTPTTLTVNARTSANPNEPHLGVTGATTDGVVIRPPLWQAPLLGVADIGKVSVATVNGVGEIIRGVIPAGQAFQGPVGIVKFTGEAASAIPQFGFGPLLFLAGFLSLNLAFFNVLPIPGLDGGRLLFIAIEVARRGKRVSPQREGLVHLIGMAALLLLVLLVTINDISNFGR